MGLNSILAIWLSLKVIINKNKVPIIVMTATSDGEELKKYKEMEVVDFIEKPLKNNDLILMMAKHLK